MARTAMELRGTPALESDTSVTFDQPTADTGEMLNKIYSVLAKLFNKDRRYKKAGIVFYGLEGANGKQLDLFDAPAYDHSNKLYAAIDNINQRYGKRTVFHLSEGIKQS